MATIGRTTTGAASVSNAENRLIGRLGTFAAGDEITSVSVYTENTVAAKRINAALYDASNGSRLALGTEQTQALDTTEWRTIPISYTVSSVTDIFIVVQAEGGSGVCDCQWDTDSGVTSYYDSAASYGYPPPATWSGAGWGTDLDRDISLYATYTPAGGGASAPKRSLLLGIG
jgi:hypothetical protein